MTYASSDAIEVASLPETPKIELTTNIRNPRNPNILINLTNSSSGDIWPYIACVELHYDAEFWSRKNTRIVLQTDKKNPLYSSEQCYHHLIFSPIISLHIIRIIT